MHEDIYIGPCLLYYYYYYIRPRPIHTRKVYVDGYTHLYMYVKGIDNEMKVRQHLQ